MVGSPELQSRAPRDRATRTGLGRLAAVLIVFGASGWIAAEVVVPMLRGPESAAAAPARTVIAYDLPGTVTKTPKGNPIAPRQAGTTSVPYGCRSVVSLGTLTIGRACSSRILAVATTQ